MVKKLTLLEVVRNCDSVPSLSAVLARGHYRFEVNSQLVGLVSSDDIAHLSLANSAQTPPPFTVHTATRTLTFSDWCASRTQRTAAVSDILQWLKGRGLWQRSLSKWRSELYPVYGLGTGAPAFEVERAASYNFGIRTFGVHVNGLVKDKMWVAKRAHTKQTWPGYLDQVVAGGIGDGLTPWQTVVKECAEEGGIPPEIAERAQLSGTIQYWAESELGLQPETQYVFDLELPEGFEPVPCDGEVESFELWSVDRVMDALGAGQFKPNCAVCVVDCFVRRGVITPENEPDYLEILDHLHRKLPFPSK